MGDHLPFNLWATISQSAPREFVVVASAIAGTQTPIVLTCAAISLQEAQESANGLLLELGAMVRARGGTAGDVIGHA